MKRRQRRGNYVDMKRAPIRSRILQLSKPNLPFFDDHNKFGQALSNFGILPSENDARNELDSAIVLLNSSIKRESTKNRMKLLMDIQTKFDALVQNLEEQHKLDGKLKMLIDNYRPKIADIQKEYSLPNELSKSTELTLDDKKSPKP